MSAIFGLWRRDGRPVEAAEVARMGARLAHRGPDAVGQWTDGGVGLGHRLHATTPEARHERQPVHAAAGRLVGVADVRLDNRDELLAALGFGRAAADPVVTDPELLLAAYAKWGAGCLERLLGDFAFVVWDRQAQTLFAARDPMGVRPFYYHAGPRLFAFASEAKALLALPDVPRDLDELHVLTYLDGELTDRERTIHAAVRRLPGGNYLDVGRTGHATPKVYWVSDVERELRLSSPGEYAEAFREVLTEAVRCRLRSDRPIGSALSGGLDSSSIACLARDLLPPAQQPVHTFSAVFTGLPEEERRRSDESPWIDSVLSTGGFEPHRVQADRLGPLFELPRLLRHYDEPSLGYNGYMSRALYAAAREAGVGVYLEGTDGDSAVGYGLTLLTEAIVRGDWGRFDLEVGALCQRYADIDLQPAFYVREFALPHLVGLAQAGRWREWMSVSGEVTRRMPISRWRVARSCGLRPLLPDAVVERWRGLRHRRPPVLSLVHPDLERRGRLRERERESRPSGADEPMTSRAAHAGALRSPLLQYLMEVTGASTAAYGLEARFPFFDRRLLEFSLAVPTDERLRDGYTRSIFRRAMEGILPADVQWRVRKQDLSPNFRRGLRGRDRESVERLLADPLLAPYVDPGALRAARALLRADEPPLRQTEAMPIFRAAMLSAWLRQREARSELPDEQQHAAAPVASP